MKFRVTTFCQVYPSLSSTEVLTDGAEVTQAVICIALRRQQLSP